MSTERAPRNTLSRERVLTAALELADREGQSALTIRAVAAHLGVRPMSLYHHVANKEALLDALVDAVFAEIDAPSSSGTGREGTWREDLAGSARSMRAALGRHPWALGLMETRSNPGPASLAHHEAVLDTLRTAGFSLAATAHAYATLDAFVLGFALQEAMLAQVGLRDDADELAAGLDLARLPRMAEFVAEYALQPGYDFGDSFEVGLGIVLDGLASLLRDH